MIAEIAIRHSDPGTPTDSVHEPIVSLGEETMIHPNIMTSEDGNGGAICFISVPHMSRAAPNHSRTCGDDVVEMNPVHYDILHKLDFQPSSIREVDVRPAAIDSFVRGQDELVLELDLHVPVKNDPQGLFLQHTVAESALLGVHDIVVAVVCNDVYSAFFPTGSIFTESNSAIR